MQMCVHFAPIVLAFLLNIDTDINLWLTSINFTYPLYDLLSSNISDKGVRPLLAVEQHILRIKFSWIGEPFTWAAMMDISVVIYTFYACDI